MCGGGWTRLPLAQPRVYSLDSSYAAWVDRLMREPYRSLTTQPSMATDLRAYGSSIFATFLEKKVANSDAIIRQTWEQYKANNGGSMMAAIDQVLKRAEYNSSIGKVFPEFAWNNYFMNQGTYTKHIKVYLDNNTIPGSLLDGEEWQLFRAKLQDARHEFQDGNAGTLVEQVGRTTAYPLVGPGPDKPFYVEPMGVVYIEFFPTTLPANRAGDLTVNFSLKAFTEGSEPKISMVPIADFAATPHPSDNFLSPVVVPEGTYLIYRYTNTVTNFQRFDPVTAIISSVGNASQFSYQADVTLR